jgi:hypothetical protein
MFVQIKSARRRYLVATKVDNQVQPLSPDRLGGTRFPPPPGVRSSSTPSTTPRPTHVRLTIDPGDRFGSFLISFGGVECLMSAPPGAGPGLMKQR